MITKEYQDKITKEAINNINNYIEMLYISALSSSEKVKKCFEIEQFKNYLKRRGYVENYVTGKTIYTKGFVCVYVNGNTVEVWHDTNSNKSLQVDKEHITMLPITLNYFERIN